MFLHTNLLLAISNLYRTNYQNQTQLLFYPDYKKMDDEMDQLVEEVNQNLAEQEEARSSGSENSSRALEEQDGFVLINKEDTLKQQSTVPAAAETVPPPLPVRNNTEFTSRHPMKKQKVKLIWEVCLIQHQTYRCLHHLHIPNQQNLRM